MRLKTAKNDEAFMPIQNLFIISPSKQFFPKSGCASNVKNQQCIKFFKQSNPERAKARRQKGIREAKKIFLKNFTFNPFIRVISFTTYSYTHCIAIYNIFLNIFELSRFPLGTFVIALFFHFSLLYNLGLKFNKKWCTFHKNKKISSFSQFNFRIFSPN